MEKDDILFGACDYYREVAIRNPTHFKAPKLLGNNGDKWRGWEWKGWSVEHNIKTDNEGGDE